MAKTGFWLRGATGKMAGATMYKGANGETIMREIVTPSNPRTQAQNIQRIIMLTVGQSYSLMKEICDHSFEGVKAGRDTMAYYMKQNIQFCREKLAQMQAEGVAYADMYNFLPLGSKGFVANQYQIAMGSLPQVACELRDANYSSCYVPAIPQNATYGDVIEALGLQRGDQLTFIFLQGPREASTNLQFDFARVILDPTDPADFSQLPLTTPFLDGEGNVNAPSVRNEGNFVVRTDENGLYFRSRRSSGGGVVAACIAGAVIVSRKVGDSWNRSTTFLTYLPNYNSFSMGDCLQRAEAGVTAPLYSPNAHYLNNAGQGGGAAAEAGESTDPSQGGGGNVPVTGSVNTVSVDGVVTIQGSLKTITKPEGTTFPYNTTVQVTTEGLNGKQAAIARAVDNEVISSTTIANNSATVEIAAAKNVTYKLLILDSEDEPVTSVDYRFAFDEGESED